MTLSELFIAIGGATGQAVTERDHAILTTWDWPELHGITFRTMVLDYALRELEDADADGLDQFLAYYKPASRTSRVIARYAPCELMREYRRLVLQALWESQGYWRMAVNPRAYLADVIFSMAVRELERSKPTGAVSLDASMGIGDDETGELANMGTEDLTVADAPEAWRDRSPELLNALDERGDVDGLAIVAALRNGATWKELKASMGQRRAESGRGRLRRLRQALRHSEPTSTSAGRSSPTGVVRELVGPAGSGMWCFVPAAVSSNWSEKKLAACRPKRARADSSIVAGIDPLYRLRKGWSPE